MGCLTLEVKKVGGRASLPAHLHLSQRPINKSISCLSRKKKKKRIEESESQRGKGNLPKPVSQVTRKTRTLV